MRASLRIAALATAALVSGVASATQIVVDVAPFPGSVANDYVVLADRVRFGSDALQDKFQIADRFSPSSPEDTRSGEFC